MSAKEELKINIDLGEGRSIVHGGDSHWNLSCSEKSGR